MTDSSNGRQYHQSMVHYLRKAISYADDGTAVTLGKIPEDSIVIDAGIVVTTAFNDSGTDLVDIGTSDDADGFATDLDVSSKGNKAADELATSDDTYATSGDLTITATYAGANSDATAGAGIAWVAYLPNNG